MTVLHSLAGDADFGVRPSVESCDLLALMNLRLLIDGIVRQTTVLLAQLSTTSGVRSPLGQVADQVFLQLARELEAQGVRRAVAADMFGMALRKYQKKIARVTESASEQGQTLWQAVYEFIQAESPTRRRIVERFRHDGEREVASVLQDLVSHGMVFSTGEGANTAYGVTSEHMQNRVLEARDFDAVMHVVWLKVFQGLDTRDRVAAALGLDASQVQQALDELERAGRLTTRDGTWRTRNLHIPIGSTSGAEAAMLDHFRAVCNVLTSRSRACLEGNRQIPPDDAPRLGAKDGGSTFSFTLHPAHPCTAEVLGLLERTRSSTQELWERVVAHNQGCEAPEDSFKVTFYCGQTTAGADEESEMKAP